jgi:hypothetical protein
VLLIEANERAALAAISGGADMSVLTESRDKLDAAIDAPIDVSAGVDPEQLALRVALGVA